MGGHFQATGASMRGLVLVLVSLRSTRDSFGAMEACTVTEKADLRGRR